MCGIVHELPVHQQCPYVTDTEACHDSEQFLDYMNFLYCIVTTQRKALFYFCVSLLVRIFHILNRTQMRLEKPNVLQILVCCFIFVILGETADRL